MIVDFLYKRVSICAVNSASVSDALASCGRTAETVHTDLEEELRGIYIMVKNIADKAVFCNNHFSIPFKNRMFNRSSITHNE